MVCHSLLKWGRRLALVASLGAVAPAWSATGVYVDSPSGDYIGQGQEQTFASATAGTGGIAGTGVTVTVNFGGWTAFFAAKSGRTLVAGNYENARQTYNSPAQPGLAVVSPGRSCNQVEGWFEIHEATYSGDAVVAFAADLLQSCNGGPPLFAAVRINSNVPLQRPQPYARVPEAMEAEEGELVSLDGTESFDRASGVSHAWTQTAGTPVTLSDVSAARPTFTVPDVPAGGEALKFLLTVRDSTANTDFAVVTVAAHDPQDLRTRALLDSDDGDWVGQGLTYRYDESNALIHTDPLGSHLAVGISGFEEWFATFTLPSGTAWAPGMYAGAQAPAQASTRPGIAFSGAGRGCNQTSGWFEIVEFEAVGNSVTRLAVDFLQHCEGVVPALFGAIRINSNVPFDRQVPFAAVLAGGAVIEGEEATLDGSSSVSRDGDLTYHWIQTAGTAATIIGANSAMARFIAPDVAPGGETLAFMLTVTDANGHADSMTVTFHVADSSDPRTRIYIDSPSGDPVGQGQQYSFSSPQDPITPNSVMNAGSLVHIRFANGWEAYFDAQVPIAPGNYDGATRLNAERAGIDISSPSRRCNDLQGWFEVYEVEVTDNILVKFAVDFVQSCEGGPPLFGAVRINSAVPLQLPHPYARATAPAEVDEADVVQLDGSASFDRSGPITYEWTQISGPAVGLTEATGPQASFTAPGVPPGGQTLRFRLTVTDTSGNSDDVEVAVLVHDPTDPKTRVLIESDPGNWDRAGQVWQYDARSTTITAGYDRFLYPDMGYLRGHIEDEYFWSVSLRPPVAVGAELQVGTYAGAQSSGSPKLPGIDFWFNEGGGCNFLAGLGGWFEIIELEVVGSTVVSAAIDFRSYCEDAAPALFSAFRINSSVPLDRNVPYAIAGPDQVVQERMAIMLAGHRSWTRSGNALTYFWRQIAGPPATLDNPNNPTPSVQVPPGGGDFRFELEVSDGPGRVDVDEVRVLVRPGSEPQTYLVVDGDVGDPISFGLHWFFSADTADFQILRLYGHGLSVWVDERDRWDLRFLGPNNQPLQPGIYEDTRWFPIRSDDDPGLSLSARGSGCLEFGRFNVVRLAYNEDGSVQTAAIDFEQRCSGIIGTARGKLRINFPPDQDPSSEAGTDRRVEEGTLIDLDGSGSYDLQGAITYSWRQSYGRTVALTGADTARPSFTPLKLKDISSPEFYAFVLTTTDAEGLTSEDRVWIEAFSAREEGAGGPMSAWLLAVLFALRALRGPSGRSGSRS